MFRQIQRGIDFVKPTLVIWPMARCFGLPVGKVSGQFALWNNLLQCVLYMEIATMCVIRELCYNVCYTWRLLQCVLYGDFATVCVICELCYSVCYTWTLLQCVLYVDFATMCVIRGLCYNVCHMWTMLCYTWTLLHYVLYVDFATVCVVCGLSKSVCYNMCPMCPMWTSIFWNHVFYYQYQYLNCLSWVFRSIQHMFMAKHYKFWGASGFLI